MTTEKYYWALKYPKDGDVFAVAITAKAPERVIHPHTFKPIYWQISFKHPVVLDGTDVVPTYDYKLITKAEFETILAFEIAPEVIFSIGPVCWEPKL